MSARLVARLISRPSNLQINTMRNILTADQFVAGIISVLTLKGQKQFVLKDAELDQSFEGAFKELVEQEESLNVTPNFTFNIDPLHGDSVLLRETLVAAKEKELIALNNPTFHTFSIKIDDVRAQRYLDAMPLDRTFLEAVVTRHFTKAVAPAA
jgi:hypothetical protein